MKLLASELSIGDVFTYKGIVYEMVGRFSSIGLIMAKQEDTNFQSVFSFTREVSIDKPKEVCYTKIYT